LAPVVDGQIVQVQVGVRLPAKIAAQNGEIKQIAIAG